VLDPPARSFDPTILREAMARRLYRRADATGEIKLPAVPSMVDEYVKMFGALFAGLGVRHTADEVAQLRSVLEREATKAFKSAPRSNIIVSFHAPLGATGLNYTVKSERWTIEEEYEQWMAIREPPLFGSQPDARASALAGEAAEPGSYRVLDVGAGTGRNALALARRGHPVDAVEITAKFADVIRADAERESLDVHVVEGDVFSYVEGVDWDYQLVVFSEVVPDFRTTRELRGMFELAAGCLAPAGRLVFNAFLARDGYAPDDAARELGQQFDSMIFTREELTSAAEDLPLALVADDSAIEYEKTHLPQGAWPPTGWFESWAGGLDVFDVERDESPIELRWLVYQKDG